MKKVVPVKEVVFSTNLLVNKVALIIGGTGGIGFSIAKSYIENGCKVIICSTNQNKIDGCKKKLPENENVKYMVFNITNIDSFDKLILDASKIFGDINILVSSAGVHTENVDFFTMNKNEFDRVININLKGTYFLCQSFAKYCISSKIKSHILLISSTRGFEPVCSPYGISKWGLNGLIKGLANYLIEYDIIVNGIAPGTTATELVGYKDGMNIYSKENKVGRMVLPEEVGNVASLLVSDAGNMIVGEIIRVSAGRGDFDLGK